MEAFIFTMEAFKQFPKMARLSREVIVTEKIDGTNAQIFIEQADDFPDHEDLTILGARTEPIGLITMIRAGSRTKYLTRKTDNHGFAKWAEEHAEELFALGEGRHFGEWWGNGIQRGYGLPKDDKRFSLFNTSRWLDMHTDVQREPDIRQLGDKQEWAPSCCHVIPVILRGILGDNSPEIALNYLRDKGSYAAPGFMKPEGIVVFHTAGNVGFKKTIEKDESPKSIA